MFQGGGQLGSEELSWALSDFNLVVLPVKIEDRNGNCENGCEVKSILDYLSVKSIKNKMKWCQFPIHIW